jgi:hypothetical protein
MMPRGLLVAAAVTAALCVPAAASPATILSPAAIVALDDSALAKAYSAKRAGLSFEQGRFSSDGALFAFSVSQIESGDPEQVWLYDLRARTLVPVTEAPKHGLIGFTIADIAWGKDNTLYVSGERVVWQNQSDNRPLIVAATMNRSAEIKAFPREIEAVFKAQSAAGGDEDATSRSGDLFNVTARNLGHGAFILSAYNRKTKQDREIARGSWELEHFLFDGHALLRYPAGEGIVSLDLRNGTSQSLVLAHGRVLTRLLDETQDGRWMAYSMPGSCDPLNYGPTPGGDTQFICFAKVQ